MTQRVKVLLVVAVAAVVAGVGMWIVSRSETTPTDRIEVAGDVRADAYTVVAPPVSSPTPDYTIGIPDDSDSSGSSSSGSSSSSAKTSATRSATPVMAGVIATVTVAPGDTVKAGDVIAKLDTALLDLGVTQAETAAKRAHANVDVMTANLDTIDDKRSDLADARSTLADTEATLADTRDELESKRAELVKARKQAVAGQKQIEEQIAQIEALLQSGGGSTPATATPGADPAQMLAVLKQKLAEVKAGIKQIDAGLKQIDAALEQIATGESKIGEGWDQLAEGADALTDAERQVKNARDVLRAVADSADVGVDLAKARRDAATIVAPMDGVVTSAATAGTVAMTGAPVASIAATAKTQLVDTYLTAEQLRRIEVGSDVSVTSDSLEREVNGHVAFIGTASAYPPTSFPTSIVHMTRTVKVTVALDPETRVPAGTPVDLTITTTN